MKASFEGNTVGEELDMNFFFLNEDVKDVEKNLDRQLSISKSIADKLKIKYDDIMNPEQKWSISPVNSPGGGAFTDNNSLQTNQEPQINQEPKIEEVIQRKFHQKLK